MKELLIETIRTDGGVQSRAAINDDYVKELADRLKSGKKLPPIEVYSDGENAWAADGFHRLAAHEQLGKRHVRCNVHTGGQKDAAWHSCGANLDHGLRRTNADKRHAVELALKTRPELSNEAIAQHAGVHVDTVRSTRLQVVGNRPPAPVVGTDGKTYRIPPPPPGPQRGTPPPPARHHPIPPPPVAARPPPPQPVSNPSNRFDQVGKAIPDHLIPLFDRAPEVQALLGQISSVRGALRRAKEADDALFAEVNFQAAEAALQTAYDTIKVTTPYAVCPWCHGTLSDECRGCGHRGVIGEFRWDTIVPREMKEDAR
jgi:hypothetical protein